MRLTRNTQGGNFFFILTTGGNIDKNNWAELPTTAEVIDCINKMARLLQAPKSLTFTDHDGHKLDDILPSDSNDEYFDSLDKPNKDIDDNYDDEHKLGNNYYENYDDDGDRTGAKPAMPTFQKRTTKS